MSFSSDVKAELCRENPITKKCCAIAECFGILLYCNTFSAREIRIITGSEDFKTRIPRLFKKAFGFTIAPTANVGTKFSFLINEPEQISAIFSAFGYSTSSTLSSHINLAVLESECCHRAFMRGAFLAGGSIIDPSKQYHLELVTDHSSVSREAFSMLLEMGFVPRDIVRNSHHVIYFKNSESIEDFFTCIGASNAAMEIMSTKVEKNMRNAINRRVNCDSANADKVVNAAFEQLEAIRKLDRVVGLHTLNQKLEQTALLRIANPDLSLSDLAMLSDPPVTKSCLSHRIRKLVELSKACVE